MKVLKKRRTKPVVGDVFVFQLQDERFYWGRVVSITAYIAGFENCILIYIYSNSTVSDEEVPELSVDKLLIPPIATNALPWTRGYFKYIENRATLPTDKLAVHCFYDVVFNKIFDDAGRELDRKFEPCGDYGLASYTAIDELVCDTLSID